MKTTIGPTHLAWLLSASCVLVAGALLGESAHAGHPAPPPRLDLPGYGPGVAGQITRGPLTPVCQAEVPCDGPFAGAHVQILDGDAVLGTAVTNALGHFVVSVPPGDHVVRVETVDFPRCPAAPVHVAPRRFSLVAIDCDTGIR